MTIRRDVDGGTSGRSWGYVGTRPERAEAPSPGRVASSKYMINEEGMHVIRDNYCFSEKNVVSLQCRSKIG